MLRPAILPALLLSLCAEAQVDLPVFGKQDVINGYAKDIEGEVLSYFSVYPEQATTALLSRCTDGTKAIAWETAAVPFTQREPRPYIYFSWIAAHNSTTSGGDRDFDLFINDQLALTFTTHHDAKPASWSASGADSTKLVFEYRTMDRHGDAHGFAHLRVPAKYIAPGKPLRLRIVGHAQDSPDWFMTFRYTFEEKVEIKALPFLVKKGEKRFQPVQLTAMHFGPKAKLRVWTSDFPIPAIFTITNGLQAVEVLLEEVKAPARVHVLAAIDRAYEKDTLLPVNPVVPRDVYLVHHSHNDIGYSHLQTEVERIQNKNIRDALDLIDRTAGYPTDSRFVWNIESLWAVENFLGVATEAEKQRFIAAVKSGRIALSANYANILTGLCTPEEMHWIVEYADSLRKWYGLPINTAMQTDIPGMSWSMVDAYAAHGIRYLSQGPNYIPDLPDGGDRIGSTLRAQGDTPYWWKGTTGTDSILVWTAGQGYGGWHGFTPGAIKERGTRKIADYMDSLTARGYPYDMVQWRYNIVSDNGPVDSTISDFVRDWNERYASPHLILANVNDMMATFERKYGKRIPTWSGDFTPYWEDGAYSTAKEEGDVRMLSARLSNLIDAAKILGRSIDPHLLYRAKRSIVMWHEHTWGAWNSIDAPDDPAVVAQWNYKKAFADSAAWYVDHIETALFDFKFVGDTLFTLNALPWDRSQYLELALDDRLLRDGLYDPAHKAVDYQYKNDGGELYNMHSPASSITKYSRGPGEITDFEPIVRLKFGEPYDKGDPSRAGTFEWLRINGDDENHLLHGTLDSIQWTEELPSLHRADAYYSIGDGASARTTLSIYPGSRHASMLLVKSADRNKEGMHIALPFDIPNATVRIGISDTCITPESGRIPGSNNDFFCAQRWIDVSNDSMGVTIVCPQGALWEVGYMVDERKTVPGRGSNAEHYKAWKTEAHSSSTVHLYALNNYWHTNFKADQEGPITFDLYLRMHGPFKLEDAHRFGLEMTRPLITWWH